MHVAPLSGGGGHQHKQLHVLEGGLGAVAKLAEGPDPAVHATAAQQVTGEVAAWLLACELNWDDLVPITTLGVAESRFTGRHVAASLQVVWPRFKIAAELARQPAGCELADQWRVAIFDALAGNTDRNNTNWGFIEDLPRPKLIDNGNAFGAATTTSEFATNLRGQQIPEGPRRQLEAFLRGSERSRLRELLPDPTTVAIFGRAESLFQNGTLAF